MLRIVFIRHNRTGITILLRKGDEKNRQADIGSVVIQDYEHNKVSFISLTTYSANTLMYLINAYQSLNNLLKEIDFLNKEDGHHSFTSSLVSKCHL